MRSTGSKQGFSFLKSSGKAKKLYGGLDKSSVSSIIQSKRNASVKSSGYGKQVSTSVSAARPSMFSKFSNASSVKRQSSLANGIQFSKQR